MSSLIDDTTASSGLENQDFQVQEDKWWHIPTVRYLTYGDVPQLSRWMAKVIPGTLDMTLAVEGKYLKFPRPWISICFLLDLQQLSSLASAILHATSNPVFSERLYSNVVFIDHLRAHVIQSRCNMSSKEFNRSSLPPVLERWILRQFHCLSSERGAYTALQGKYNDVYKSKVSIWSLGNGNHIHTMFQGLTAPL
jgi:hypothetical protein